MSRHSKNNTALSFFTKSEFQKLDYGTKRERLGRDSLRNYDACYLCLETARDPVCCIEGHLSCKECIFENMLAQKDSISRKRIEHLKAKREIEHLKLERKIQQKKVKDDRVEQFQTKITSVPEVKSDSSTNANSNTVSNFWVPSVIPSNTNTNVDSVTRKTTKPHSKIYCTAEKKTHEIR